MPVPAGRVASSLAAPRPGGGRAPVFVFSPRGTDQNGLWVAPGSSVVSARPPSCRGVTVAPAPGGWGAGTRTRTVRTAGARREGTCETLRGVRDFPGVSGVGGGPGRWAGACLGRRHRGVLSGSRRERPPRWPQVRGPLALSSGSRPIEWPYSAHGPAVSAEKKEPCPLPRGLGGASRTWTSSVVRTGTEGWASRQVSWRSGTEAVGTRLR